MALDASSDILGGWRGRCGSGIRSREAITGEDAALPLVVVPEALYLTARSAEAVLSPALEAAGKAPLHERLNCGMQLAVLLAHQRCVCPGSRSLQSLHSVLHSVLHHCRDCTGRQAEVPPRCCPQSWPKWSRHKSVAVAEQHVTALPRLTALWRPCARFWGWLSTRNIGICDSSGTECG